MSEDRCGQQPEDRDVAGTLRGSMNEHNLLLRKSWQVSGDPWMTLHVLYRASCIFCSDFQERVYGGDGGPRSAAVGPSHTKA